MRVFDFFVLLAWAIIILVLVVPGLTACGDTQRAPPNSAPGMLIGDKYQGFYLKEMFLADRTRCVVAYSTYGASGAVSVTCNWRGHQ